MAEDLIRYDILAQDALRGVVRKVLSEVAQTGLPGDHHFFVSFATRAPGVRISSRLLDQYPEEMTIVLQHQFWDLSVTETAFEVGLSFNNVPERLLVPFAAIRGFADPSAKFALQFETPAEEASVPAAKPSDGSAAKREQESAPPPAPLPIPVEARESLPVESPAEKEPEEDSADERAAAEVVNLDAFRKK